MGDVHLAEDSKLRRMVAIKTIRADLCKDAEICKRIERECLLHAKIGSHPHIVTLFDRLEHGSQINLVMEYVEGETLQDLLVKGASGGRRLSWKDGINIAVQTLEALSRIHAHGIVHRDIKPSNIIVTRDDSGAYCAKLMDFGIARMEVESEQSTMLTKDGGGPGTPTYMAPEQIDPKTFGPVSSATDVYAMGVMLYQILSGQPPFTGSLTEVFNGHLNRQPPAIDFHGDTTVPAEIKDILECALAKKPSQRFPSVKVFREELLRVSQGPLTGGAGSTGGEDTNKTMLASKARAAAVPDGRAATMLDTSGGRPRTSVSTGKLVAIIIALLIAAGAIAAYMAFSGKGSGEPETEEKPAAEEVQKEEGPVVPADGGAVQPAAPVDPAAAQPNAAVVPAGPEVGGQAPVAPVLPGQSGVPTAPGPEVQPVAIPEPPPNEVDVTAPGTSARDAFRKAREERQQAEPEPAPVAQPAAPAVQPPAPATPPAAVEKAAPKAESGGTKPADSAASQKAAKKAEPAKPAAEEDIWSDMEVVVEDTKK